MHTCACVSSLQLQSGLGSFALTPTPTIPHSTDFPSDSVLSSFTPSPDRHRSVSSPPSLGCEDHVSVHVLRGRNPSMAWESGREREWKSSG